MNRLVRAELLKLRTTRSFFWLMIGVPIGVVVALASSIATAGQENGSFPLDTVDGVRNVLSAAAGAGGLIVLILGILGMSGEYRHQTVTQTFLVTPVRGRVVLAKLVAYALVGLATGAAAGALTVAVGLPWLASKGADVRMLDDVGVVLAGTIAATVVYGLMGVAVGALFRNPTAAIVLSLTWMLVLESLLVGLLPEVGRWLPAGAATALSSGTVQAGDLLPTWAAGPVLLGYVSLLSMAGARVVLRRDVA